MSTNVEVNCLKGKLMNRIFLQRRGDRGLPGNFLKYHGTFSYFIGGGGENFLKKGGGKGSSVKISKSTMVLLCSFIRRGGGWMVN